MSVKSFLLIFCYQLGPCQSGHTASRKISEVKQLKARSVIGGKPSENRPKFFHPPCPYLVSESAYLGTQGRVACELMTCPGDSGGET